MWWDTMFLGGVALGVLWVYQHRQRWTWYLRWGRWHRRWERWRDQRAIAWLGEDYLLQRQWTRLYWHWHRVPAQHR